MVVYKERGGVRSSWAEGGWGGAQDRGKCCRWGVKKGYERVEGGTEGREVWSERVAGKGVGT